MPSYYNQDYTFLKPSESEADCENMCSIDYNCALFVYFEEEDVIENINAKSCLMFNKFDIDTAVQKFKSSSVYALRSKFDCLSLKHYIMI